MTTRQRGMVQIIASGICFGFLGLFGKQLLSHGVLPGEMLTLRFFTAALFMLLLLLLRRPQRMRLDLSRVTVCVLLGVFGYAVFAFCYFTALQGLSASLTVLLLYTYPALVAAGGWLLFAERIPREKWLALPLAALGLCGLVWGEFALKSYEYLAYGMASALVYALYILCSSRFLKGSDPMVAAPIIQLGAGFALAALYLHSPERAWTIIREDWLIILGLSLVSTVLAMSLFLAGLQKLKGWEVSLLSTTEPLVGVALGALLLGEQLTATQLAGGLALILALVWVSLPRPLASSAS